MTYFVSLFVVIIALLASFALYYQGPSDKYLRLFPYFLLIVTAIWGICTYLAMHTINNMTLFNPLTIFQCSFYFYILYRIIRHPTIRKMALHLIWIYPLIAGINILFIQKINTFHTITYSLGGLLVVAFCVFYFFELFQRPQSVNLSRNPDFWVCSGLLFYFSCSFPIYGMANQLNKIPRIILRNLNQIFTVLDVLLYLSFAIAFLCRLKIRKSSL